MRPRSALVVLVLLTGSLHGVTAAPASADVWTEPQWTGTGPSGGQIRVLATAPSNPRVVYAGTNGSGVWRSSDGGLTWVPRRTGLRYSYILSIVVDPRTALRVYATTEN